MMPGEREAMRAIIELAAAEAPVGASDDYWLDELLAAVGRGDRVEVDRVLLGAGRRDYGGNGA